MASLYKEALIFASTPMLPPFRACVNVSELIHLCKSPFLSADHDRRFAGWGSTTAFLAELGHALHPPTSACIDDRAVPSST